MGPSEGAGTIAARARLATAVGCDVLRFFKFRQDLRSPQPAKDVYVKRPEGRGWPEECPPIRAANSFGFDLLANFDVSFTRKSDGGWRAEPGVELASEFDWSPDEETRGRPLVQNYAWFWDKGQEIPHKITDDVYEVVRHQVKVSTFLFLATDPNEVLLMGPPPNAPSIGERGWRAVSALAETDWYPASYPWHAVLELYPSRDRVEIKAGDVLVRATPLRRDTYFAQQMSPGDFDAFFERGQRWLATHGRPHESGGGEALDITRTYVKQQAKSRFIVLD